MTFRAVPIGLLLAFSISAFTYFNDHVIRQTYLIGTHFPIAVFGFLLFLVLLVNPVLRLLRLRRGVLRAAEIAVVLALGLAACGWPGSSFFRAFTSIIAVPPNCVQIMPAWKAAHVMSYVPGASPLLGEGHVADWAGLARDLSADNKSASAVRVWGLLEESTRNVVSGISKAGRADQSQRTLVLNGLNDIIDRPDFYSPEAFSSVRLPKAGADLRDKVAAGRASEAEARRLNRMLFQSAFPGRFLAPPKGTGILLADGDPQSPAVQSVLQGTTAKEAVGLGSIHWRLWWPTIRFWGALAILLGIASVCIVVVVQPQWKRELLPYPIGRFVDELTRPADKGVLPAIMQNRLFWLAFAFVATVHLFNGLNKWFPQSWFVTIPLRFDFGALQQLFPAASRIQHAPFVLTTPQLFPTVIAFAFFLSSEVSFSVGVSGYLYLIFATIMTANGALLESDFLEPKNFSMLRFGAYLGLATMLFFLGRRYYVNVAASSLGFRRHEETPRNAVWAARILLLCVAGCVFVLSRCGLDWVLGTLFVLLTLLTFFVMTRINVETGMFFIQPLWGVTAVITMLFGVQTIGPTAYVVMAVVTTLMVLDPREAVLPFVANGLYIASDRDSRSASSRVAVAVGLTVAIAFAVALVSVLLIQYRHGLDNQDTWATGPLALPGMPFRNAAMHISELSAYDELTKSLTIGSMQRLTGMSPDWVMLQWAAVGVALVLVCNLLRLRLSWWPLHPVIFVLWGTMPGCVFAPSFLLGWAIKVSVVKMSGAKGHRMVMPFMVGLIAGEMLSALGWTAAGAIYFWATGMAPESYQIFPG